MLMHSAWFAIWVRDTRSGGPLIEKHDFALQLWCLRDNLALVAAFHHKDQIIFRGDLRQERAGDVPVQR